MSHSTHHSLKQRGHRDHAAKVGRIADHHGHGEKPATKAVVKQEVKAALGKHDAQMHHGKHTRLGYAGGGSISDGMEPTKPRLDRPGRKSGGKAGKKGKAGNHVNIVIAGHGGGAPGGGPPIAPPGAAPVPHPPPAPPPMMPPGAGMPPGVMPAGMPPGAAGPRPPMAPPGGGAPMPMMRAAGGRTGYARGGKANGGDVAIRGPAPKPTTREPSNDSDDEPSEPNPAPVAREPGPKPVLREPGPKPVLRQPNASGGKVHMTAGSKSGIGRLEKEHAESGREHHENEGETEHYEGKSAVGPRIEKAAGGPALRNTPAREAAMLKRAGG